MNFGQSFVYHGGGRKAGFSYGAWAGLYKVKVSAADKSPDFLNPSIQAGSNITTSIVNPGLNEVLKIDATDRKVAINDIDTTPKGLFNAIQPGNLMTKMIIDTGGGDLALKLDCNAADRLVGVSALDTNAKYLNVALEPSTNITTQIYNSGGDERLRISATDNKVSITNNDTTPDKLDNKLLVTGAGITKTVLSPSGNEKIELNVPDKKRFTFQCSHPSDISVGTVIRPGTPGTTWGNANIIGFYFPAAAKIIQINVVVGYFQATGVSQYTRFNVRKITANGAMTSDGTYTSGTSLGSFDLIYGYSDGTYRYYKGGNSFPSYDFSAGEMVFVCVSAQTVAFARGVSVWLLGEYN